MFFIVLFTESDSSRCLPEKLLSESSGENQSGSENRSVSTPGPDLVPEHEEDRQELRQAGQEGHQERSPARNSELLRNRLSRTDRNLSTEITKLESNTKGDEPLK